MPLPELQSLQDLVAAARSKPAVTAKAQEDQKAYTPEVITFAFGRYVPLDFKHTIRSRLLKIPKTEPLQRLDSMSQSHLEYLFDQVRAACEKAEQKHGPAFVSACLAAAQKACDPQALALLHSADHDGSSYADVANFDSIRTSKKLIAPDYFQNVSPRDGTLVYMQPVLKGQKPSSFALKKTHFRVDTVAKDLVSKSTWILSSADRDDNPVIVGGNHFQTAWILATAVHMLRYQSLTENMEEVAKIRANSVLEDMRIPRELSLAGQVVVEKGQDTLIGAPRATPKERPAKKRDITPDPANPNMKNEGRKRNPTD